MSAEKVTTNPPAETADKVTTNPPVEANGRARDSVRICLSLHYDGSGYSGWQLQPGRRTVQGDLEAALGRLCPEAGRVKVVGSGRTDAGVHATGQVAAANVPVKWTAHDLGKALNAILGDGIWVETACVVPPGFHPRFDAVSRTYTYRIGTDPSAASPHESGRCWPICTPLDLQLLRRGAEPLVGRHSFEAFARAGQPEHGFECRVLSAGWEAWRLGVVFTITANRFLHRMVRYLVGTMADVARGRRTLDEIEALLAVDPELVTSPPAPARGLFLSRVEYS